MTEAESAPTVKLEADNVSAVNGVKDRLKFFFSDANVRQDKFIRRLLMNDGSRDNDTNTPSGMVPIEALLRFNTIKKFTTEASVVVQAAKLLPDALTLDDREVAIGRVVPFTSKQMNKNVPLSLLIKNVPIKDADSEKPVYDVTLDDLRAPFEKYGTVSMVSFRFSHTREDPDSADFNEKRWTNKKSKKYPIGQALIEYETVDDLENAAKATLTVGKGGDKQASRDKIAVGEAKIELDIMLLSDYIEQRKTEGKHEKNGSGNKKRSRDAGDKQEETEIATFTFDWKPNCVIRLEGLPDGCDREAILGAVGKGMGIEEDEVKCRKIYADFSRGQTDGAIRFPDTDDVIRKLAEKLKNGDLEIAGAKVGGARILEGEEEKKYWDDFIEFKNKQIRHKEEERRQKKKRKGGGRRN